MISKFSGAEKITNIELATKQQLHCVINKDEQIHFRAHEIV